MFRSAYALELAEKKRFIAAMFALTASTPSGDRPFKAEAKVVVFHAQMLADFNTIDELAWKFLKELDARPQSQA